MRFLFNCLAIISFFLSANTSAAVYIDNCTTFSSTFSPPDITVMSNLNIGDKIGNVVRASPGTGYAYICAQGSTLISRQVTGFRSRGTYAMTTSDGVRVYKTSITGVGYAVGGQIGNCPGVSGWVGNGDQISGDINSILLCRAVDSAISSVANLQLYKIAEKTGYGTVTGATVGTTAMLVNDAVFPSNQSAITMNSFKIINPGCTVRTPSISVPMGTVGKNQFNGIGTYLNVVKDINISLNCPIDTVVAIKFDGNVLDASKGLFNITSETNSSTGVAIQLLYNSLPIQLASPLSVGTAVTEGTFTIPLQARYYQSGATVTPGSANGSVTFTLTYN